MASYLDEQYQFAPYVETTPVDEMVKVGMAKQQMFDEGFQKVQSWFDQLASLPTAREVDAQYVQGAINNLNAEIGKVVGADWSNQQLLNAVGGLATKISRDKNIVTAVQSANRIAEGTKKVDEDRSKGTLRPENEDAFYESVMNFRKTTDLGRSFNDDYSPGFDVEKYVKEMFNESLKPDGLTYDMVFKTDANGNAVLNEKGEREYSPTMNRFEWESPTFQRVRATLDKIFAEPRVAKQLEITGRYVYKPYGGQQLKNIVNEKGSTLLRDFDNSLTQLYYRKEQAKTEQEKLQIQQTIDDVLHNKEIVTGYYNDLIGAVDKNPEGVRANIYKNEIKNGFTSMYNWKKTKYLQMDNPGAAHAYKLQQLAFDAEKLAEQLKLDWFNAKSQDEYRKSMAISSRIRALKGGSGGDGGDGVAGGDIYPDLPESPGIPTDKPSNIDPLDVAIGDFETKSNNFKNATNTLLWEGMLRKNPAIETTYTKYINNGLSPDVALEKIIEEGAKNSGISVSEYKALNTQTIVSDFNNLTPDEKKTKPQLAEAVESFRVGQRDFKVSSDALNAIEERAGATIYSKQKVVAAMKLKPQTVKIGDNNYELSPDDIYDLAVVLKGNTSSLWNDASAKQEAQRARKSLEDKGLEPVVYDMLSRSVNILERAGESTGPITGVARTLRYAPYQIFGDASAFDTQQVEDVFKWLNTDGYVSAIEAKKKAANEIYYVRPNTVVMLTTGKPQNDEKILQATRVLSSAYASGTTANNNPNFKGLREAFAEQKWNKNNVLSFNVDVKADGTPVPQITMSNGDKIVGQMDITMDEARKVYKQNPYALFEPDYITVLRNAIELNPLKRTSVGKPSDIETYKRGEFYHTKEDFPGLVNSNLVVNVNYSLVGGKFYPYVYASDGQKEAVFQLSGADNLNVVYETLKNYLTVPVIAGELQKAR